MGKMENGEVDFQDSSFKFQTKSFITQIHKHKQNKTKPNSAATKFIFVIQAFTMKYTNDFNCLAIVKVEIFVALSCQKFLDSHRLSQIRLVQFV